MENFNSYTVLAVDAWAECVEACEAECTCEAWTWNNWFNTGEIYSEKERGLLTEESALEFFYDVFEYTKQFKLEYSIEDDQYNLCLVDQSRRPIYAIVYGDKL